MSISNDRPIERIREHWEKAGVVSLKDGNLRNLEIDSIVGVLNEFVSGKDQLKLADFGCGDGLDTEKFSKLVNHTIGYDYSSEMLLRAKKFENETLKFSQLDLLTDEISQMCDIAISKRCIINLGSWENQSKSLRKIGDSIKPGGLYIMLECFVEGLDEINIHRSKARLPKLEMPFHNTYLNYEGTIDFLKKDFEVIREIDFSTYYFLTRCLLPTLSGEINDEADSKMKFLSENNDFFKGAGIGPQRLLCLRKR
jgi:SAM-dependent methyltransferase